MHSPEEAEPGEMDVFAYFADYDNDEPELHKVESATVKQAPESRHFSIPESVSPSRAASRLSHAEMRSSSPILSIMLTPVRVHTEPLLAQASAQRHKAASPTGNGPDATAIRRAPSVASMSSQPLSRRASAAGGLLASTSDAQLSSTATGAAAEAGMSGTHTLPRHGSVSLAAPDSRRTIELARRNSQLVDPAQQTQQSQRRSSGRSSGDGTMHTQPRSRPATCSSDADESRRQSGEPGSSRAAEADGNGCAKPGGRASPGWESAEALGHSPNPHPSLGEWFDQVALQRMQQMWAEHAAAMQEETEMLARNLQSLHGAALQDLATLKSSDVMGGMHIMQRYASDVKQLTQEHTANARKAESSFADKLHRLARITFVNGLEAAMAGSEERHREKMTRMQVKHDHALVKARDGAQTELRRALRIQKDNLTKQHDREMARLKAGLEQERNTAVEGFKTLKVNFATLAVEAATAKQQIEVLRWEHKAHKETQFKYERAKEDNEDLRQQLAKAEAQVNEAFKARLMQEVMQEAGSSRPSSHGSQGLHRMDSTDQARAIYSSLTDSKRWSYLDGSADGSGDDPVGLASRSGSTGSASRSGSLSFGEQIVRMQEAGATPGAGLAGPSPWTSMNVAQHGYDPSSPGRPNSRFGAQATPEQDAGRQKNPEDGPKAGSRPGSRGTAVSKSAEFAPRSKPPRIARLTSEDAGALSRYAPPAKARVGGLQTRPSNSFKLDDGQAQMVTVPSPQPRVSEPGRYVRQTSSKRYDPPDSQPMGGQSVASRMQSSKRQDPPDSQPINSQSVASRMQQRTGKSVLAANRPPSYTGLDKQDSLVRGPASVAVPADPHKSLLASIQKLVA